MPQFFAHKNKYGAPFWGIGISALGILPLLFFTASQSLVKQVMDIIDFSVTAFLFVYLICCLSFIKLLLKERDKATIFQWFFGIVATSFCVWAICGTSLKVLLIASLFVASGIPAYFFWYHRKDSI
jgi:APA family basic amino acid/polyamine antiporter